MPSRRCRSETTSKIVISEDSPVTECFNCILCCRCEEVSQENLRLIEERDMLMLKLSTTMRQLEGSRAASMAGSRTTTPVPDTHVMKAAQLQPGIGLHFDPSAEIRGLHAK